MIMKAEQVHSLPILQTRELQNASGAPVSESKGLQLEMFLPKVENDVSAQAKRVGIHALF